MRLPMRQARARIDAHERDSGRKIRLEVDGGVKVDNIADIARDVGDSSVRNRQIHLRLFDFFAFLPQILGNVNAGFVKQRLIDE